MTTVRDIIYRAFRKANITAVGETPTDNEGEEGLSAFNEMVSGWAILGVNINTATADFAINDPFPFADKFREGTIYMLASRISPEYNRPESFDSDRFMRALQAASAVVDEMTIPAALLNLPSQRFL